jgi:hypothetical protein
MEVDVGETTEGVVVSWARLNIINNCTNANIHRQDEVEVEVATGEEEEGEEEEDDRNPPSTPSYCIRFLCQIPLAKKQPDDIDNTKISIQAKLFQRIGDRPDHTNAPASSPKHKTYRNMRVISSQTGFRGLRTRG